jgi:dienelactone hydrolase
LHAPRLAHSLALTLALAACSGPPAHRPPDAHAPPPGDRRVAEAPQAFLENAWRPRADPDITAHVLRWRSPTGDELEGSLLLPGGTGPAPVVLYLPGLGEDHEGGARWRRSWASVGYAVLSVQALRADADAFRSPLARQGEFGALGREQYASDAVQRRLDALAGAWAEARQRGASAGSPWARLDWQRVAVCGYDIGAYTAMALAGEHVPKVSLPPGLPALRAAIVLSPYPDVAGGVQAPRYADVAVPVLGVTGQTDLDQLGLVRSPAMRHLPIESSPTPGSALLLLRALSHAALGARSREDGTAPREDRRQPSDGDSRAGRGGGTPGEPPSGGGRGDRGDRGGRGSRSGGFPGGSASERGARPTEPVSGEELLRANAALVAVTTATLDAQLKGDPRASQWLRQDAPRWLATLGELRARP